MTASAMAYEWLKCNSWTDFKVISEMVPNTKMFTDSYVRRCSVTAKLYEVINKIIASCVSKQKKHRKTITIPSLALTGKDKKSQLLKPNCSSKTLSVWAQVGTFTLLQFTVRCKSLKALKILFRHYIPNSAFCYSSPPPVILTLCTVCCKPTELQSCLQKP